MARKRKKIYKEGMTLDDLAKEAAKRYAAKEAIAKIAYNKMKDVMATNYDKLPFGDYRKLMYKTKIKDAVLRFDPERWETKWKKAMSITVEEAKAAGLPIPTVKKE